MRCDSTRRRSQLKVLAEQHRYNSMGNCYCFIKNDTDDDIIVHTYHHADPDHRFRYEKYKIPKHSYYQKVEAKAGTHIRYYIESPKYADTGGSRLSKSGSLCPPNNNFSNYCFTARSGRKLTVGAPHGRLEITNKCW